MAGKDAEFTNRKLVNGSASTMMNQKLTAEELGGDSARTSTVEEGQQFLALLYSHLGYVDSGPKDFLWARHVLSKHGPRKQDSDLD
jgi:hypothetical protein